MDPSAYKCAIHHSYLYALWMDGRSDRTVVANYGTRYFQEFGDLFHSRPAYIFSVNGFCSSNFRVQCQLAWLLASASQPILLLWPFCLIYLFIQANAISRNFISNIFVVCCLFYHKCWLVCSKGIQVRLFKGHLNYYFLGLNMCSLLHARSEWFSLYFYIIHTAESLLVLQVALVVLAQSCSVHPANKI